MKNIKDQFPIFSKHPSLVYLDNAATTQKPQVVIDAMVDYYTNYYATVYRGMYQFGEQATQAYEDARAMIAQFIGAKPDEIVFVKNTTEGINLVASAWAVDQLKPGDQILLTEYEHHANILPWQQVAQQTGAQLVYIPVLDDGTLDYQAAANLFNAKTKLVSFTAVSNVTGAHTDCTKLITAARKVGAKILLDAAQLVAHKHVNVHEFDVDFMVFSGHKLFGPTGIGVLYIKSPIEQRMRPYQVGGGTIFETDFHQTTYAQSPYKFEAGTPPIAQAIGLAAAINWLKQYDLHTIAQHEASLIGTLINALETMPHIRIVGPLEQLKQQGHLVSFVVANMHAHDVAAYLNKHNIAVRAGHHCAQPLAKKLGIEASIRVSVTCYNDVHDIEKVLSLIAKLKKDL